MPGDLLSSLQALGGSAPAPQTGRTALVPVSDFDGNTRYYYPSAQEIELRRQQRFQEALNALPPERRAEVAAAQSTMDQGYGGITQSGVLEPVSGFMGDINATAVGPVSSTLGSAAQSAGMARQGLARARYTLQDYLGFNEPGRTFADTPDAQLAEEYAAMYPTDPNNPHAQTAASKVGGVVGGLAPIVGASVIPGVGPLISGGTIAGQAYEGTTQEAMSHGYTEKEARGPAAANAIVQGGLMSLPLGHAVMGKLGGEAVKSVAGRVGMSAAEGAGLMGTARAAENVIAGQSFDPMRGVSEGVGGAALEGAGVVGGLRATGIGLKAGANKFFGRNVAKGTLDPKLARDISENASETSTPTEPGAAIPVESLKQVIDARSAFKQMVESIDPNRGPDLGFDSPGAANRAVDDVKVASKAARGVRDMVKGALDQQDQMRAQGEAEIARLTDMRDRARSWLDAQENGGIANTDYTGRIQLGEYIRNLDERIAGLNRALNPEAPAGPPEQYGRDARENVGLGSPTSAYERNRPAPPPTAPDARYSERQDQSRVGMGGVPDVAERPAPESVTPTPRTEPAPPTYGEPGIGLRDPREALEYGARTQLPPLSPQSSKLIQGAGLPSDGPIVLNGAPAAIKEAADWYGAQGYSVKVGGLGGRSLTVEKQQRALDPREVMDQVNYAVESGIGNKNQKRNFPRDDEGAGGVQSGTPQEPPSPPEYPMPTNVNPDAALVELTDLTRKLPVLRGKARTDAESRIEELKRIISDPTIPESSGGDVALVRSPEPPTEMSHGEVQIQEQGRQQAPETPQALQDMRVLDSGTSAQGDTARPSAQVPTAKPTLMDLRNQVIDITKKHRGQWPESVWEQLQSTVDSFGSIDELVASGGRSAYTHWRAATEHLPGLERELTYRGEPLWKLLNEYDSKTSGKLAAREATAKPPVQPSEQPPAQVPIEPPAQNVFKPATHGEAAALPKGSIYELPVKNKDGSIVVKYAVRSGNERGFGDSIHESVADAAEYLRREKIAEENAEKSRQQREQQETQAAAEQARRNDIDGFAADKSPFARGKIISTLNQQIRSDGVVKSRKEHIRDAVAKGVLSVVDYNGKEVLQRNDGRVPKASGGYEEGVVSFWELGSPTTEVAYAKHLLSQKSNSASPSPSNRFYDAPADAQRGANGAQRGIPGLEAESAQAEQLDLMADKLNYATHPTNMLLRNQLKNGYREGMREALPLARTKPRELNDEAAFEQNAREVQEALLRHVDPDGTRAEADPAIDEYAYEAATKLIREHGREMSDAERSVQTAEQRLAESTAAAAGKMGEAAQALFSEGSYAVSPEVRVVDRRLLPKGNETQEWVAKFPYRVERLLNGKWREVTKDVTVDDALSSAKNWAEQLQSPVEPPPKAAVSPRGESAALSETPATALPEKSGPTPADRVIKLDELPKYVYEGKAMDKPPSMRERKAIARNAFGRNVDPANPSTHAPSTWINKFVRDVPGFKHNPTFIVGTTPDGVRLLYKDTKNGSYAIKPEWFGLKADDLATGQRITIDLTKPDGGPGGGAGKSVLPPSEQAYSAGNTIFTAERRRAAFNEVAKSLGTKLYSNPLDVLLDPKVYRLAYVLAGEFAEHALRAAAGTGKRGFNEFKRWMREQVSEVQLKAGMGRTVSLASLLDSPKGTEYLSKLWNDVRKYVPRDEAMQGRMKAQKSAAVESAKLTTDIHRAAKVMNTLGSKGFGKSFLGLTGLTDSTGWNPARELAAGTRDFGGKVQLANQIYKRLTGVEISPSVMEGIKGSDAKSALGHLSAKDARIVLNTMRAVEHLARVMDERDANSVLSRATANATKMSEELVGKWPTTLTETKKGQVPDLASRNAVKRLLLDSTLSRAHALTQITGKKDGTAWHRVLDDQLRVAGGLADDVVGRWEQTQRDLQNQHKISDFTLTDIERNAVPGMNVGKVPMSEGMLYDVYLADRTLTDDGGIADQSIVPAGFSHDPSRNVKVSAEDAAKIRDYIENKSPHRAFFRDTTALFDGIMNEVYPAANEAHLELTGRELGRADLYYHLRRAMKQSKQELSEVAKRGDVLERSAGSWGNIENLGALKEREGGPLPLVVTGNPIAGMFNIVRSEADYAHKAVPARNAMMTLQSDPLRVELQNRLGSEYFNRLVEDVRIASGAAAPKFESVLQDYANTAKNITARMAGSYVSLNPTTPLMNVVGYIQLAHELPNSALPHWAAQMGSLPGFLANYSANVNEVRRANGTLRLRVGTEGHGQLAERSNPFAKAGTGPVRTAIDYIREKGMLGVKMMDNWVTWAALQVAKKQIAATHPTLTGEAKLKAAGELAAKWITRTQNPTDDAYMSRFSMAMKKAPAGDLAFMLTAGQAQERASLLASMYAGKKVAARSTAIHLASKLASVGMKGLVGVGIGAGLGTLYRKPGEDNKDVMKKRLADGMARELGQDVVPGEVGDWIGGLASAAARGEAPMHPSTADRLLQAGAELRQVFEDPSDKNWAQLTAKLAGLAPDAAAMSGLPATPFRYPASIVGAAVRDKYGRGHGSGVKRSGLGGLRSSGLGGL